MGARGLSVCRARHRRLLALAPERPERPAPDAEHAHAQRGRGVGTGHVLAVSADPRSLLVSYRARFDNFGTGRRTTVLQLVFDRGRYLIDGERG